MKFSLLLACLPLVVDSYAVSVEKDIFQSTDMQTSPVQFMPETNSVCIGPGREVLGNAKLSPDFISSLKNKMNVLNDERSIDTLPVTYLTQTSHRHVDYYNGGVKDPVTGLPSGKVEGRVGFITLNTNPDAFFQYGDESVPIKSGEFVHFDGGAVPHNTVINSGFVKMIGPFEASHFGVVGRPPTASPTTSPPTPSPTNSECKDNDEFTFGASGKVTCAKVYDYFYTNQRKWFRFCARGFYEECPFACGVCCEDDTNYTFKVKGKERDCAWLAGKGSGKVQKVCNKQAVSDACQVTCGSCDAYYYGP